MVDHFDRDPGRIMPVRLPATYWITSSRLQFNSAKYATVLIPGSETALTTVLCADLAPSFHILPMI